jgi:tRNA (guanine-N7-)-methyltransferase
MTRQAIKIDVPDLRLDPEAALDPARVAALFTGARAVEIEIGIGKGRFLLACAEVRPDVLHLGIEWANKYLRIAESRAAKRGLANVLFARVDARAFVERAVPSAAVSSYYVFYPDPWPKARHHKRRFLQPQTVAHLARTLVAGGHLHVATDHEEYWLAIEDALRGQSALERLPEFGGAAFPLPVDQPLTNFETKYGIEGRRRFRASWRRTTG